MPRNFYVYEHWRPDLNFCFYVGKGKKWRAGSSSCRNSSHKMVVQELAAKGLVHEIRVTHRFLSEEQALSLEIVRIAFWREQGHPLVNRTLGGNGFSGPIAPETRAKISAKRKGIKFSDEHCSKLSSRKTGKKRKPFSEETKQKMREAAFVREENRRNDPVKNEMINDKIRNSRTLEQRQEQYQKGLGAVPLEIRSEWGMKGFLAIPLETRQETARQTVLKTSLEGGFGPKRQATVLRQLQEIK